MCLLTQVPLTILGILVWSTERAFPVISEHAFQVTIAGGDKLQSEGICKSVQLTCQGVTRFPCPAPWGMSNGLRGGLVADCR